MMMRERDKVDGEAHEVAKRLGHQPEGTRAGVIFAVAAGLTAIIVIASIVVGGIIRVYSRRDPQRQYVITSPPPNLGMEEPARTIYPTEQIQEMRREAHERLTSYGWIDVEAGVAHIPIERALELYLERLGQHESAEPTVEPVEPTLEFNEEEGR